LSTFTFQGSSSGSHNMRNILLYAIYWYVKVSALNFIALCLNAILLHIDILWQL